MPTSSRRHVGVGRICGLVALVASVAQPAPCTAARPSHRPGPHASIARGDGCDFVVVPGGAASGSLSFTDPFSDGRYYDIGCFSAVAGVLYSVTVTPPGVFSAVVISPSGAVVPASFTASQTGVYLVRISTVEPGVTASYQVFLTSACTSTHASISANQTASGSLAASDCTLSSTDLRYYDTFDLGVSAGGQYSVGVSAAFDAIVRVTDTTGHVTEGRQVYFIAGLSGTATIVVTSVATRATGSYTLAVAKCEPETLHLSPPTQAFGQLSAQDCYLSASDRRHYDTYDFAVTPDRQYTISVTATFIPALAATGPGTIPEPTLPYTFRPTAAGTVTVQVTSLLAETTGSYTIGVAVCSSSRTSLAPFQTYSGQLSTSDCTLNDLVRFFDEFTLAAQSGVHYTITMSSSAFAPLIVVYDGAGGEVGRGDEVTFVARSAMYRAVATSRDPSRTGAYTVALTQCTSSRASLNAPGTRNGRLETTDCTLTKTDLRYYDEFVVAAERATEYRVSVATDEFEPVARLVDPAGSVVSEIVGTREPSGARIVFFAPDPGLYTVVVTSSSPGQTGRYAVSYCAEPADLILPGETLERTFSLDRCTVAGDSPAAFALFKLRPRPGFGYTLTASSATAEPVVSVLDATGAVIAKAGAAGSSTAEVTFVPTTDGLYLIRVSTALEGQTGRFTLSVSQPPVGTPPDAPSSLRARHVRRTKLRLRWHNVRREEGYSVAVWNGSVWVDVLRLGRGETTGRIASLAPGTEYAFRVRAYNEDGFSSYSDEIRVTTKP
jgi:hypothetical protein